ncbi:hypothetical protein PRJ55_004547 [Salmonella enterica]|nr:hypothetical protein [Salmonella enterica]
MKFEKNLRIAACTLSVAAFLINLYMGALGFLGDDQDLTNIAARMWFLMGFGPLIILLSVFSFIGLYPKKGE